MCGKKEYICQGQSHNYLRKQNIQSFAPPPAVFGAIALGEPCYRNAVANTSRRIILNAPEKGRCITKWPLLESTTTTFNPHRSGMGGASAVQPEFLHQPGHLSMLTTPVKGGAYFALIVRDGHYPLSILTDSNSGAIFRQQHEQAVGAIPNHRLLVGIH